MCSYLNANKKVINNFFFDILNFVSFLLVKNYNQLLHGNYIKQIIFNNVIQLLNDKQYIVCYYSF